MLPSSRDSTVQPTAGCCYSAFTLVKLLVLPPKTESSSLLPPNTFEPPPKRPAMELTPTPMCADGASTGAKRGYRSHATSAIQSVFVRPYSRVSCLKCMATMQYTPANVNHISSSVTPYAVAFCAYCLLLPASSSRSGWALPLPAGSTAARQQTQKAGVHVRRAGSAVQQDARVQC